MSASSEHLRHADPSFSRPAERERPLWAMALFIATEAMLFVMLFFAYFYLAGSKPNWPLHEDPSYTKALIMLGVLLLSSGVAHWGQKGIERGDNFTLQLGLVITLALGGAFIYITYQEYAAHLKKLTPWENAYGSIFYTITSLHFLHLVLGLLMLTFVLLRSFAGHFNEHRHAAVKNAVRYWHFVDLVWLFVVGILYLSPQFYGVGTWW